MSRKFREIYMLEFLFIRTKTPFPPFLGESFFFFEHKKTNNHKIRNAPILSRIYFLCIFSIILHTKLCPLSFTIGDTEHNVGVEWQKLYVWLFWRWHLPAHAFSNGSIKRQKDCLDHVLNIIKLIKMIMLGEAWVNNSLLSSLLADIY